MKQKNKLQLDLSGGMNTDNTPLTLKDNEAELIVNYVLNRYGGLRKRFGMRDLGPAQEIGNYPIIAIGGGRARSGTTFIHTNGNLYEWVGGSWNSSIATIGSAYPASFCTTNGNDNSTTPDANSDPEGYTFFSGAGGTYLQSTESGSTWVTDNCPGSGDDFRPRIIAEHLGRVYGANWSDAEHVFWFSSAPTPETGVPIGPGVYQELTWDLDSDWVQVDLTREANNTAGLGVTGLHSANRRLFVFTQDRMVRFDQASGVTPIAEVGAHWNTCIVTNRKYGITFFAGADGIYAYSPYEGRPRCISNKIRRLYHELMQGSQTSSPNDFWYDPSNVRWGAAATDEENVYFRPTKDIDFDGKTISNPVLCYNIPLDAWTILSFDKEITCFYQGQGEDLTDDTTVTKQNYGYEIMAGTADGYIMQFQDTDNYADNDGTTSVPIESEYRSKEWLLNTPNLSALDEIDVFSIENSRTQVFFDVDRKGEFKPVGEVRGRFSEHPVKEHSKLHSTRIKLTDNTDSPGTIEGYGITYTEQTRDNGKPRR